MRARAQPHGRRTRARLQPNTLLRFINRCNRCNRSATHNGACAARWDGRGAPQRAAALTAGPRTRVSAERKMARALRLHPLSQRSTGRVPPSTARGLSGGTLRRVRVLTRSATPHSRGAHAVLTLRCAARSNARPAQLRRAWIDDSIGPRGGGGRPVGQWSTREYP